MKYDDDDTGVLEADVGRRLRKIRDVLGIRQKDLLDVVGMVQSGYSYCETGERLLPVENPVRLAERYNLTLDWIYRGDTMGLRKDLIDQLAAKRLEGVRKRRKNGTHKTPQDEPQHGN